MLNPTDLLAALPPPRDDEPPSLRSEIVDELLDHLQCAFRREILKDGDEAAAEKRVLSRFGDPKQLARRLWWQAMWSRVMGKRILSGVQWLLTLAAVFLAGAVLWQQSQMLKEMTAQQAAESQWRQNLSRTLDELRTRLPAPIDNLNTSEVPIRPVGGAPGGMAAAGPAGMGMMGPDLSTFPVPTLTVKLVQEKEDGPPVTEQLREIQLFLADGRNFPGAAQQKPEKLPGGALLHRASVNGRFNFMDLAPDRYELRITLADGQHSTQPVLIRDDKPQELTVICPPPRTKAPVLITGPALSEKVQSKANKVKYYVEETPITLGTVEWFPPEATRQVISFDAATRFPVMVDVLKRMEGDKFEKLSSIVLSKSSPEDRAIFLLTGPVQAAFVGAEFGSGSGGVTSTDADSLLRYTVEPGGNAWTLAWTRQAEEFFLGPATTAAPADAAPDKPPKDASKDTVVVDLYAGDKIYGNSKLLSSVVGPLNKLDRVIANIRISGDDDQFVMAIVRDPQQRFQQEANKTQKPSKLKADIEQALKSGGIKHIRWEEFIESDEEVDPAQAATKPPMPADEPAAQSDLFPGLGRIVVKLSRETKDGKRPGMVVVNLLDEKGGLSLKHVKRLPHESLPKPDVFFTTGHQPDDKHGLITFDVEPGRYGISVLFRDGLHFAMRLKPVDAGETLTEHVICPPAATKTGVLITAPPVPEDLRRDDLDYEVTLVSTPFEFEGRNWRMFTPVEQPLVFDQATGHAIRAGENDLSQDKPEDREVFLPAGKYRLHYSLALIRKENGEIKVENLARRPGDFDEDFEHVISPTEKTLQIKIADDFWAEARKKLAELDGKPAKEMSEKAAPKEDAAGLSLAVFDEDHQRPMRGVRVTLHRTGEHGFTDPQHIAEATTTAQGQVGFSELSREEVKAVVTVPGTNLRSVYTFDLSQPQRDISDSRQPQVTWFQRYALSAPSRVESAGLTFRTNLPDDLAAAKVRVCFGIASDAVTVNKQTWSYSSAFERIVVGPNGFEGMLQLPLVSRNVHEAFLAGHHRVSPAAEREIRVPALRLSANRMTLICPIKSTPAEGGDAKVEEWMVCATTPVMKRMNDDESLEPAGGSSFRLDPVALESNEWLISVPDEMFAEARKKLAELEGKPVKDESEKKATEDTETPADAAAKTLRENARRPQGFRYDQNYAWLRGYVDFDREAQQWFIVYSATPKEDERFAGNLTLGDHKLLNMLKAGDHVIVEGKVEETKDESAKPRYQIDRLMRLK